MDKLHIKNKFGVIPNEILNNPKLSLKAKGLWVFIQSKPEGWNFSAEKIATQSRDGIESVKSGLQELEKAGLLKRDPVKAHGVWAGYEYTLLTTPENPSTENQPTGNHPTLSKKEEVKKNKDKKENTYMSEKNFLKENEKIKEIPETLIAQAFKVYSEALGVKLGVGARIWSRPYLELILQDHAPREIGIAVRRWKEKLKKEDKDPVQFINMRSLSKFIDAYLTEKQEIEWE